MSDRTITVCDMCDEQAEAAARIWITQKWLPKPGRESDSDEKGSSFDACPECSMHLLKDAVMLMTERQRQELADKIKQRLEK